MLLRGWALSPTLNSKVVHASLGLWSIIIKCFFHETTVYILILQEIYQIYNFYQCKLLFSHKCFIWTEFLCSFTKQSIFAQQTKNFQITKKLQMHLCFITALEYCLLKFLCLKVVCLPTVILYNNPIFQKGELVKAEHCEKNPWKEIESLLAARVKASVWICKTAMVFLVRISESAVLCCTDFLLWGLHRTLNRITAPGKGK